MGSGPEPTSSRRGSSAWLQRAVAEIRRGRHLILHGNIHDLVWWRGDYLPLEDALAVVLENLHYRLIGFYDPVDHLRVRGDDDLARFEHHVRRAGRAARDGGAGRGDRDREAGREREPGRAPAPSTPSAGRTRTAALERRLTSAVDASPVPAYDGPQAALTAIRRVLAQDDEPAAFVVDGGDLLLFDPAHGDQADRSLLGVVKKAMLGAAEIQYQRNLLILTVGDLAALPEWLYRDEPFVQTVEVLRPTVEEREAYLQVLESRFHGASELAPAVLDRSVRALANLSDGMALTELDGLWRTSRAQRIPLDEPRELINRTRFGRKADPWAAHRGRDPRETRARLGARVVGQDAAVDRVGRALTAATLGIDLAADPHSPEARPKGVFFFVGPTGVGKTELVRALSELVFDDEAAMCRFDMSSFSEPHNAERFYGAPPGYVGHERGGELTNRMHQRPFSVLLFDEVEKAHESIFDKFLQVLEDGRLTDGLGRTAYFSQSLIVFTSNLGADSIYRQVRQGGPEGLPTYEQVSEHFEQEVRRHFAEKLRRPELLGRLGDGIVSFDIVRPEHVPVIVRKFLGYLVRNAGRKGVRLEVDEEPVIDLVVRTISDPAVAALGYRQVPVILTRALRDPLVHEIAEHGPDGHWYATVEPGSPVATVVRH
ncbi:AAA family ATPase [Catenulispora subtropica]